MTSTKRILCKINKEFKKVENNIEYSFECELYNALVYASNELNKLNNINHIDCPELFEFKYDLNELVTKEYLNNKETLKYIDKRTNISKFTKDEIINGYDKFYKVHHIDAYGNIIDYNIIKELRLQFISFKDRLNKILDTNTLRAL